MHASEPALPFSLDPRHLSDSCQPGGEEPPHAANVWFAMLIAVILAVVLYSLG